MSFTNKNKKYVVKNLLKWAFENFMSTEENMLIISIVPVWGRLIDGYRNMTIQTCSKILNKATCKKSSENIGENHVSKYVIF